MEMNEFSVRKPSKAVYGDEEAMSKYRMLRPNSGANTAYNLFAGGAGVNDATIKIGTARDYPIGYTGAKNAVGEFLIGVPQ